MNHNSNALSMSSKQLKWAGIACVVLSALSAGLGFALHMVLLFGSLLIGIIIHSSVTAAGGVAATTTITVPPVMRVSLCVSLCVSGLLLTLAAACFLSLARRRPSPPG